jgi:hypothetical protein
MKDFTSWALRPKLDQMIYPKKIVIQTAILLSSILTGPMALAELDFLDLKDLRSHLRVEYQYLSPESGFMLLETETLENLRFFGNYGAEKAGLGCFSPAFAAKNDCPHDAFSKLIQRLFPSPNGFSLTLNRRAFDLESHLTSRAIGIILTWAAEARKFPIDDPAVWESSRKALKQALESEINESINSTDFRRKGLEKRRSDLSQALAHSRDPNLNLKIRSKLVGVESALTAIKPQMEHTQGVFRERVYEDFSALLVAALKETLRSPHSYSPYWVEHIFLAYFWKRSNKKAEILDLFSGMPQFLVDSTLLKDPVKKSTFLTSRFRLDEVPNLSHLSEAEVIHLPETWVTHTDQLAVLFKSDHLKRSVYPQMISGDQTKHTSLGTEHYPDCGETSIRNFLNVIAYQQATQSFRAEIFKNLAGQPGVRVHPQLIAFYEKYPHISGALSSEAREEWSEKVVSAHPDVRYRRPEGLPQCEIDAGLKNFLRVIDRLLFADSSHLSSSRKLDRLARLFSRPGFKLTWRVHGGGEKNEVDRSDTGVQVEWIINESPEFISVFDPMHFAMKPIQGSSIDAAKQKILEILSKKWLDSTGPKGTSPFVWLSSQGGWSVVFPHLAASEEAAWSESFFYSLPLHSPEDRSTALKNIPQMRSTAPVELMKRIARRFPEEDFYSQKMICSSFLTHLETPSALRSTSEPFFRYFSSSPLKKASLLFCLIQGGKVAWLEDLLSHPELFHLPEDLLATDPNGKNLAKEAAETSQFDALRWLAQRIPGVLRQGDLYGSTPIHSAALTATPEFFTWIAESDPTALNLEDHDHFIPAQMAAYGKNWELLKWMMKTKPEWIKVKGTPENSVAKITENMGNPTLAAEIRKLLGN